MTTAATRNKDFVLESFDILFNERNFDAAAERWSNTYLQHSAHIGPGREGLFELVRSLPAGVRYENQVVVAEGEYVMLYGRFTGNADAAALVAADVVRMQGGKLAEHWDVWQNEVTRAESKSGLPMIGDQFPGE